jgi:hypothetical protein
MAGAAKGKSSTDKPKSINLLDIREIEVNGKSGVRKATKIQLAKGVQITFNGQPVDFGEYNSAFLKNKEEMLSSLEYLVDNDYMAADEAEEKAKFYEEKGIVAQLTVKI